MGSLTHIKNVKIVCDPLWGLIDITEYIPMVDVWPFQALGFKYQLGVVSLLFPSATHTRKQHSFGAFHRTQEIADRWYHKRMITKEEARLMTAYALWHDIGHGPFSHVVEDVTREFFGRDHDQNGASIIDRLRPTVEAMEIDFTEFKKLFTHENSLYRAIHDKNLGTEKLDYLARDAYYTIGEIPGVEYLAQHTYFVDRQIVIDEKAIDQAKSIQEFYVKMYKNVYLRKNSAIAQRMMQKMTAELLRHKPMSEEDFWALTDFGLLGHLETSDSQTVREYYRKFMLRDLPKTAIALRPEKFATISKTELKPQLTMGIPDAAIQRLLQTKKLHTPSQLELVEKGIERIANLPPHSVVVVPPASVERFVPQDIVIYMPGGKNANLSDYYTDHFHALEEEGRAYTVLRVCTFEEHRKVLSSPETARTVSEYIQSLVK